MNNINIQNRPYVSIVVPMYNEEGVVFELYERLFVVMENLDLAYEIIFVEDGSLDNTFNKLLSIQKKDEHIKLIKLRGNFGQTPALAAGFDHAIGDIVIGMDGDLQHLPEDIPKFIEKIEEGYDIVSGWRKVRKDPLISRRLPSKIANSVMAKMSGIALHDFGTTFKAYRREILDEINLYGEFHRFIPVLASWMKAAIVEIPIKNIRQQHRKSHYNITRSFTVFFDLIRLNFLNKYMAKPLQLFGTLGFVMCFIGFFIDFYLVYLKYAFGLGLMAYRGPLFILGIFLMIVGLLFIILGLIAEMIYKLFHDLSKRKIYSIKAVYVQPETTADE